MVVVVAAVFKPQPFGFKLPVTYVLAFNTMSGHQLEGEYGYAEDEDSVVLTVETESWIELNNGQQQHSRAPPQSVFEESEFIEEGVNDESMLLSEMDEAYEDDTDEYTPLEQSENDLDRSLNTLLNGGGDKVPLGVGHHRQHHTPRYNSSKVTLESLRLVHDDELRNNPATTYASSDTTCSSASSTSRANKRRRKTSNATTNSQMDLSTFTLAAAAGISIVAGLSFSAGYAFGRRSAVKISA